MTIARALTIAGSDSGGGAGLQADLRTFAFHKVHGMSAVTCLTAQNTLGVQGVMPVEPDFVALQVEVVAGDIGLDAVKTGMLLNAGIIARVARLAAELPLPNLVVDPVMVSRTGAQLIDDDAVAALKNKLLPLAMLVTPNLHEARLLSGIAIETVADMQTAARRIAALGARSVLIKGGALAVGRGTDVWYDGGECVVLMGDTVDTPHTHGTGCTLAAAIAANLALGLPLREAIVQAKAYVTAALCHSLAIGRGQGPVGHFWPLLGDADG
ncbi:MAG: bifunctional hydroxymethylpyrimidine kinase/phosphomethylpyrimidine kinase [Aphanocapsa lilacina HA4352-LM1]|nr:bifunctional hydroxymethylpyrimidine kinase/phosphomethylpyrimidine kinase [Aphanocapsa lilacina HA4352-LM1]